VFCPTQPQLPSVRPIAARVRQLSEDLRSSAERHTQQTEPGVQAAEVPQLLADRHVQRASRQRTRICWPTRRALRRITTS